MVSYCIANSAGVTGSGCVCRCVLTNVKNRVLRWHLLPATPRHMSLLLPLLPSGPGGVYSVSLRGDRQEIP